MFSTDPLAPVYLLAASVISVAFYAVHNAGMRAWVQQTFRDALTQAGASARAEIVKWAGVSTIGVLGVLTTGATANHLISVNFVGGAATTASGQNRGGGTPSSGVSYSAPTTPTHDAVVFASTGDSLRILGSTFDGSLDDTQDSFAIQVDTAGGDFSSPQYFNDTLGAVITDTIPAIDSGAVVVSRIAYKGLNGDWSAWSDSLSSTMTVQAFRANEPAGMTQLLDWDFCNVYAAQLDGTGGSSSVVGLSPTVSVEDWNKGEPLGPTGFGLDSFNVAGMASAPCVHVRPYPDGLPSGQGASTYQWSLGASRATVYWSGVFRFRDDGDGFEHNTAMKMLYFLGGTNFWFGKNGSYFAIEQITNPGGGDVLYPTSDSVTVASLDGTFFEAEGCIHAGSGDGQFFLWINGVQQADYTNLTFSGPANMQWAGTYGGGTPSTKTGTEYADIDDLYVSYGTGTCN